MSKARPMSLRENGNVYGNGNVAKIASISAADGKTNFNATGITGRYVETSFNGQSGYHINNYNQNHNNSQNNEPLDEDERRKHLISPIEKETNYFWRFFASRKFLILLIVLLGIFAAVCFVLLLIVNAKNEKLSEDAEFLNRNTDWRNTCEKQCKMNFDVPPLLLISMDGFRADYFQHDLTPAVSRILECGTRADFMIPSFPSKTFPNHYTIVTGLYPEAHGIIDNMFMDPLIEDRYFSKRTNDSRWYYGEPIWNTAAKNSRKSATFFWPGSEVPVQGVKPTYLYLYDMSTPFSKRVDQAGCFEPNLNWYQWVHSVVSDPLKFKFCTQFYKTKTKSDTKFGSQPIRYEQNERISANLNLIQNTRGLYTRN